ncbi:MAG: hypothetical protein M1817_004055 [Caeruleum heppii]|nr:MAG: hypothetical protein M1817_004055 [Caeruleum heppii]
MSESVLLTTLFVVELDEEVANLEHNSRFRLPASTSNSVRGRSHTPTQSHRASREETPVVTVKDSSLYVTLADGHKPFDPTRGWVFGADERVCDICITGREMRGVSKRHFSLNVNPTSFTIVMTSLSKHGTVLTSSSIGNPLVPSRASTRHIFDQTNVRAGLERMTLLFPARDQKAERIFNNQFAAYTSEAQKAVPQLLDLHVEAGPDTVAADGDTTITPRKRAKIDHDAEERKYSYGRVLGEGDFGIVRVVYDQKTGNEFAAKMIDPEKLSKMRIEKEENVVRFVDSFRNEIGFFIVMELLKGGDLKALGRLQLSETIEMTRQVLQALTFLHGIGITHRDIKPANILVERRGKFKLADFGLSKDQRIHQTICGTPLYLAPEVHPNSEGYSNAVDIWSLGVVVLEAHWGLPDLKGPFDRRSWLEMISDQGTEFRRHPTAFGKIVGDMLYSSPNERAAAAGLLRQLEQSPDKVVGDWTVNLIATSRPGRRVYECPVPQCPWSLLNIDAAKVEDHLVDFHLYRRQVRIVNPFVYVLPDVEQVNASHLLRISGSGPPSLGMRLKQLGITREEVRLRGVARGAYVTYADARKLCASLDLDSLPLQLLFRHGGLEGRAAEMEVPLAIHAQLFVRMKDSTRVPRLPLSLDAELPPLSARPSHGSQRSEQVNVEEDANAVEPEAEPGFHTLLFGEADQWPFSDINWDGICPDLGGECS